MALKVETPSIESLKEGVEMTLKQLSSPSRRTACWRSCRHRARSWIRTSTRPCRGAADQEANTVVSVLQKGYMIADRLLRPGHRHGGTSEIICRGAELST
jgi:molecular chaperone GrpE